MTNRQTLVAMGVGGVLALGGYFVFGSADATGATRSVQLDDSTLALTKVEVDFVEDGGCLLTGYGYVVRDDGKVEYSEPQGQAFPFNGARCGTLRTAAAKAVSRGLRFDGGSP